MRNASFIPLAALLAFGIAASASAQQEVAAAPVRDQLAGAPPPSERGAVVSEHMAGEAVSGETGSGAPSTVAPSVEALPDAPDAQAASGPGTAALPDNTTTPSGPKQTKRILFIIPNFRSVSADTKLPRLTPKDKFKLFFSDSFDYSAFVEVGLLAGLSDLEKSEPEFHHGAAAYARYYWHGFADATDANFWVEFAIPVVAHEDPRYYTLGHGGFVKRTVYSVSRLLITRSDSGGSTPNFAEVVGNGAASGVSNLYYPSRERDWTKTGQRWLLQLGVDGLSNLVKEFWPDINQHLFRSKD